MRQRAVIVSVRLSDDEAQSIRLVAERHALSPGQYLRARALQDTSSTLPLPLVRRRPLPHAEVLAEVAVYLGRIGGCLHEMTRKGDDERHVGALSEIRDDLRAMRDLLLAILRLRKDP